jgi:hypothetical protein
MVSKKKAYGLTTPFIDIFPEPVYKTAAPSTTDKNFDIGQVWIYANGDARTSYVYGGLDSSGDAVWILTGPGSSEVDTLTGDSGGAISPSSGNINILGGDGLTVAGSGSTLTINRDSKGGYPITPYVVGSSGEAGYTTIQSAVNAANSAGGGMVWIQSGTYTEDLTLYDGIALFGDGEQNTTIVGTHTPPTSGTLNINRVTFQDATAIFSSAAAGTTSIIVEDSTVNVTNGFTFDLDNWTGLIAVFNIGNGGTNDGFLNNSGGASFAAFSTGVGNGTGQTMVISGDCFVTTSDIECPIDFQTGSTGTFATSIFLAPITLSNDSALDFYNSSFVGGASAAITMSSSGNCSFNGCEVSSSNNPSIAGSGAGTLSLNGINFLDNAAIAATVTLSSATTSNGTFNTLDQAAGLTISSSDIDADGTDSNIDITLTPKGTGSVVIDNNGLTSGAGTDLKLSSASGQDIVSTLGDSAGATNFIVEALDGTDLFTVVSDGTISFSTLTVTGAFTQSGGTASLNASSNFNTVINTGTSTGTVTVGSANAGAITVDTGAGISLDAATASNFTVTGASQDLTLSSIGGSVKMSATEDAAGAIALTANGGTSETITVTASQGVGVDSITLDSTAGGLTLSAGLASADAINLAASAGGVDIDGALQVNIASSQNAADAVRINASAGGIDIDAAGAAGEDITLDNAAGSIVLTAAEAAADSIVLSSTNGGIDILAAGAGLDLDLSSTAGSINITSGEDDPDALVIQANGGTTEKVQIIAAQGTGADSISLSSTAGGITLAGALASADAINLAASAGGVDIDGALQVNIASSQNASDAVFINSSAGGMELVAAGAAGEDIDITCTAGSVNITAGESAADAIVVNASGAAGAIQLQSGTGGVVLDSGLTVNVTALDHTDSAYSLLGSDYLLACNTSGGVLTITLPASPATGRTIVVADVGGSAGSQNITINGNGNNISNGAAVAATAPIDSDYGTMTLYYSGSIWIGQDIA